AKVVLWSENRAEWLAVLWGCLLEGVVVVPVDYRFSAELMLRIAEIVDARVIVTGDTVTPFVSTRVVWSIGTSAGVQGRRGDEVPGCHRAGGARGAEPHTTAEIIFTSGSTADPKGVVLTHRNILANIIPIDAELRKYRRYLSLLKPIRFLNLLPLSHMFGQSMATFVPPLLEGEVIFMRSLAPQDVVTRIRESRVSVLVCVPKILEVLRDHVIRQIPEARDATPKGTHWVRRWWTYRRVHRLLGFRFWAIVVGAAPLDAEVEGFWGELGFVVIQGYGLTETAPVVTLNHPFHGSRGAVGKPIPGVDVRIADDGEILVRGDNVTSGYFNAPEETQSAFRDGWFHTGDVGELDAGGHLRIRGRKKEMIVTPEGLNVFPNDVERVLNAVAGVREAAVVGAPLPGSSAERVQAILVTDPDVDVDTVIRTANLQLLAHQKIRAAAVWTAGELPRTEGTRKLRRRELRQWLAGATAGAASLKTSDRATRSVASLLERFAPGRTVTGATTIDELGLSSLERVELMMAIEEAFEVTVDEGRFAAAATVADLEGLTRPLANEGDAGAVGVIEPIEFPSWNRSPMARAARIASLATWILPPLRLLISIDVRGLEHLRDLQGPVIFAANHQSHLDTPAILAALPGRWRNNVAPAMLKEFFKAHFFPNGFSRAARMRTRGAYYLAALFFNAFPLAQRESGTRQTLRYAGELVGDGQSILIFPEGKRTDEGEIIEFQRGVAMLSARLGLQV
ncbi:MAG: AMP-binding protein, partial [Acidobacteria bacterium]|nr:AMP-binding protein [Acidobacteriota bacterium]